MKIGYVRCSSKDQNPERQEVLMSKLGVEKVYIDMLSGKDMNRPQLQAMLEQMQKGDVVIVESFSRLARNTKDLLEITDIMKEKGVDFISQKETIDTSTPAGKLMLTVLGAISEFERECIRQRQAEGIALKKARGEYKGRVARDLPEFDEVYQQYSSGQIKASQAIKMLGISRSNFYQRVKAVS